MGVPGSSVLFPLAVVVVVLPEWFWLELALESPPAFEGSPWSVVAPFSFVVWFVFWSPASVPIVVCESVVVWFRSSKLNEKKMG